MAELTYFDLCEKVEHIIKGKGYTLVFRVVDGTHFFDINNKGRSIANLQITNTTGSISVGKTRNQHKNLLEDQDVIYVSWISTEHVYRGQQLALLILIYGICYLKTQFPNITYVILDDDSDRSASIKKNIYDLIGFSFRDTIEMDIKTPKKLKLSGPEKQLLLGKDFIQLANRKLDNIEPTCHARGVRRPRRARPEALEPERNRKTKRKARRNRKAKRNRKTKRKL